MTAELKDDAAQAGIDVDEVLARLGGDEALLVELTGIFVEDSREMLRSVRGAVERSEAAELRAAAHKAKGAIGIFGSGSALQLASELESYGMNGEIGAARQALPVFETELKLMAATLSRIAAAV